MWLFLAQKHDEISKRIVQSTTRLRFNPKRAPKLVGTLNAIVCSVSIAYRISEFVSNLRYCNLFMGMGNRSTPAINRLHKFTT